jgi:uncharacterized protein YqgC (DUF456 family)
MQDKADKFALNNPLLKKLVGVVLVLLGFVSLITPMTPGAMLMLFIGFQFLGLRFMFLDRIFEKKTKLKSE